MSNKYLTNLKQEKTIFEYLTQLINTSPSISMIVEAWHYENRTTIIHEKDMYGRHLRTRTETQRVRVSDLIESQSFEFNRWLDTSQNPDSLSLDHHKVTR